MACDVKIMFDMEKHIEVDLVRFRFNVSLPYVLPSCSTYGRKYQGRKRSACARCIMVNRPHSENDPKHRITRATRAETASTLNIRYRARFYGKQPSTREKTLSQ